MKFFNCLLIAALVILCNVERIAAEENDQTVLTAPDNSVSSTPNQVLQVRHL